MRYLGIDYGTKYVGLAVSDADGRLAFPKSVVANDNNLLSTISVMIEAEDIEAIVIGESVDQTGKANNVQIAINDFVGQLSMLVGLPVHYEKEMFTSLEASKQDMKRPTARKPKSKIIKKDDSAAALILQRYLDKQ